MIINQSAAQDSTDAAKIDPTTASDTSQQAVNPYAADPSEKPSETAPPNASTPDKADTQPGPPEKYADFTLPEGFTAPTDDFMTFAKEMGMTQEAAQKTIDFYVNKVAPVQEAAHEKMVADWTKESESKYTKADFEAANKALGRFSTPAFMDVLKQSGLCNHPAMVGVFKEIASRMSESVFAEGQNNGVEQSAAKLLFGRIDK